MTSMRHNALSQFGKVAVLFVALALLVAGCAAPSQEQPATTQTELASPTPIAPTDTPKPATPIPTEVAVPTETTPTTAISATGQAPAALAGAWEGELVLPSQSLKIIVVFKDQDDQLSGTIRIPAQLAADIPLHDIRFEAPQLHFEMLSGPQFTVFDGELQPDGGISGSFTQSGYTGDFTLSPQPAAAAEATAVAAAAAVAPYRQEEVTFKNGDVTLAGTLTLPEGTGPFPAVLLLSGSGQQIRDEEIALAPGYKPFQVIADTLTRQGIAVLRYDDRGVGQSTGDPSQATTIDFADDAEAGIDALLANPEIDSNQVGVLGHSEGGMIAAMLAARNPDVAFVIGMAPPAVSGYDFLVKQTERVVTASGASAEEAAKASEQQRQMLDLAVAKDWQGVEDYMKQLMIEENQALPVDQQVALGDLEKIVAQRIQPQIAALKIPWVQAFLTYDAGQDWAKTTVPVLALFGGLDVQVDVEQNRLALEAALDQAKNPDVTVKVFPDANHLFLQAKTGGLEEYASLPTDFVPGFLDTISDWLVARVNVKN